MKFVEKSPSADPEIAARKARRTTQNATPMRKPRFQTSRQRFLVVP